LRGIIVKHQKAVSALGIDDWTRWFGCIGSASTCGRRACEVAGALESAMAGLVLLVLVAHVRDIHAVFPPSSANQRYALCLRLDAGARQSPVSIAAAG